MQFVQERRTQMHHTKQITIRMASVLALAALFTGLLAGRAPRSAADPCDPAWIDAYEEQVLQAVNVTRTTNGLQPLSWNADVHDAARGWSAQMAASHFANHTGPGGDDDPPKVVSKAIYRRLIRA